MRWKDFLYFQRGSRLGVILLLILIVLTLILQLLISSRRSSRFVLQQNDSLIQAFEQFRSSGEYHQEERIIASGGETEGLKSVSAGYGSKTADASEEKGRDRSVSSNRYVVKLRAGETIKLNEADTSRWKMIPGIGTSYASRIVKYRELLGGYVSKDQLLEVYGMNDELFARISPYIAQDSVWRPLPVNLAEFSELLRHPYLNYEQVQAIFNLRRKKGEIQSIRELAMLDQFTQEDIKRLEPYLEF